MFENTKTGTEKQLREVKTLLNNISPDNGVRYLSHEEQIHRNIEKGIFFVSVYAAIEYMFEHIVEDTINIINSKNLHISILKKNLYALTLNSIFESIDNGDKKWKQRSDLLMKIEEDPIFNSQILFPSTRSNIKSKTVKALWNFFCIKDSAFHENAYIGKLDAITENRNKIAHGRESASNIGKQYSKSDVEQYLIETERFCNHVFIMFEQYIVNEDYKL